ncbi:MAG: SsrA-binding protein SmpB [Prevotella sp.]|nr:SsrA-binding protein SmpB [Prevotella sp.]
MKKTTENLKKAENRKARFDYEFVEEFVAGIVLTGCEIKSIRLGNVSINESYCYVKDGEVFVKGMNIAVYYKSGYEKTDPLRERKLLLNKKEIRKLKKGVSENGMTIVPTTVFINDKGLAKMKIALAKGKHTYDKKQAIKERDIDRQTKKEY